MLFFRHIPMMFYMFSLHASLIALVLSTFTYLLRHLRTSDSVTCFSVHSLLGAHYIPVPGFSRSLFGSFVGVTGALLCIIYIDRLAVGLCCDLLLYSLSPFSRSCRPFLVAVFASAGQLSGTNTIFVPPVDPALRNPDVQSAVNG